MAMLKSWQWDVGEVIRHKEPDPAINFGTDSRLPDQISAAIGREPQRRAVSLAATKA